MLTPAVTGHLEVLMSNNNVQITGHVGQDPTTTEFESGATVTKFSVAVKNYKDGE
jgi:single-stranded DNA-binding protein